MFTVLGIIFAIIIVCVLMKFFWNMIAGSMIMLIIAFLVICTIIGFAVIVF